MAVVASVAFRADAVSAITLPAVVSFATHTSFLVDQVQYSLLRLIRGSLQRCKLETTGILLNLALSFVVLALRLVHDQNHAIVDLGEALLI